MAEIGNNLTETKPLSASDLQRYCRHDHKSLASHVARMSKKYGWRSVKDWARGDFSSWYAASMKSRSKFKLICPSEFRAPHQFCGFNLEDCCFVFDALGIVNDRSFNTHRRLFNSLRENDRTLYLKVIFIKCPSGGGEKEFVGFADAGIEDFKGFCVYTNTTNIDLLTERFPSVAARLNDKGWSRRWFWDAVHIILRLKPLPADYHPAESMIMLSIDDLVDLEYSFPGPR